MRTWLVILLLLWASVSPAEILPGSSVDLQAPKGFDRSDRFLGYYNESSGSSIMIAEVPAPYKEVAEGFASEPKLAAKGMKLHERSKHEISGQNAELLLIEQSAFGKVFKKWMLIIDNKKNTILLSAAFLKENSKTQQQLLKTTLTKARLGKYNDPANGLKFSVTPAIPFKQAKILGQSVVITPGGQFPIIDENIPVMVAGLSAQKNINIKDRKAFVEQRIVQTNAVTGVTVQQTKAMKINKHDAMETMAQGKSSKTGQDITIYQVTIFKDGAYAIVQGLLPSAKKSMYLHRFQETAKSFRFK